MVKLAFPRCQKEDADGSIVYEKNCRNGKECSSYHGYTLVLQTTGYSSSSPKLLRIPLKNFNAHRYFRKCKMLLSSHVTLSSSRMTGRVSMWFYPVPSSKSLAHATSANWRLGTLFKSYCLYCHAQLFLSVQLIRQRMPYWFFNFDFIAWNSFGYSENSQFDRCSLISLISAHKCFLSKCCLCIDFGFALLLVKADKLFVHVKEHKWTQINQRKLSH